MNTCFVRFQRLNYLHKCTKSFFFSIFLKISMKAERNMKTKVKMIENNWLWTESIPASNFFFLKCVYTEDLQLQNNFGSRKSNVWYFEFCNRPLAPKLSWCLFMSCRWSGLVLPLVVVPRPITASHSRQSRRWSAPWHPAVGHVGSAGIRLSQTVSAGY